MGLPGAGGVTMADREQGGNRIVNYVVYFRKSNGNVKGDIDSKRVS